MLIVIKLHVCSLARSLHQCWKIVVEDSCREQCKVLVWSTAKQYFCVSIENTSVKSLHWPSFMPVSSVCPPCSATLLQCFIHYTVGISIMYAQNWRSPSLVCQAISDVCLLCYTIMHVFTLPPIHLFLLHSSLLHPSISPSLHSFPPS